MKEAPIISRPMTTAYENGYRKVWKHCQHRRRVRADDGDGWVCLACGCPMPEPGGPIDARRPVQHEPDVSVEVCPVCHQEHEIKRTTVNGRFFGGQAGDVTIQSCPNLPRDTFVHMKDGRPYPGKDDDHG